MMPEPIYFTDQEGGDFIPWSERKAFNGPPRGITAHSIHFKDGSVFDCFNGWRKQPSGEPK